MRAQLYSIIAILIALPIIIFTANSLVYSERLSSDISEKVISDQIHQLASSIEIDTGKALEISGRRALLSASNFVVNSGKPLSSAVSNLTTLMMSGRINNSADFMMTNNTIPEWEQRISSNPVNFLVDLQYSNLTISNLDGFSIIMSMDVNITVSDKLGIAKIEKIGVKKTAIISVENLEDPLYPLNTQGFIRRIIRQTPIPYASKNLVTGSVNSSGTCSANVTFNKSECGTGKILVTENLNGVVFACYLGIILEQNDDLSSEVTCSVTGNISAVELINESVRSTGYAMVYIDDTSKSAWSMPIAQSLGGMYYYHGTGPDFLSRLEGKFTPSQNGIESFVYIPELEEQGFPAEDYSIVDHLYFSEQVDCYKVRNMPEWFRLDGTHVQEHGFGGLAYAVC